MKNPSIWNRLSIGHKLVTVVLIFVLAFAGLVVQIRATTIAQSDDFAAVDIMGRQRMLKSQLEASALKLAAGLGDRRGFELTRDLLIQSHRALAEGGEVRKSLQDDSTLVVPAPPNAKIAACMRAQEELLPALVQAAEEVQASDVTQATHADRVAALESLASEYHELVNQAVKAWTASFQKQYQLLFRHSILFAGFAVLIASLIAFVITRSIVRSLGAVVERAQKIGRGDLRGDPLSIGSQDEVGQLAAAVNQMVESLRQLTGQTLQITSELASTVQQIYSSTQQQSAASRDLAGSVQEITSTVQEIHQSGTQIGERAKGVAATTEETAEAGEAGRLAAVETNRNMSSIREQVEALAQNIVGLSEKTKTIGEIISAVTDMADQSNLLALNAAIESASAGEQGSRFGVVASEMKNLADQAKTSTVQVRSILSEIQRGISSSVMLTEETVKRVESGKLKADSAETTIGRMREATLESVSAFQQILGGSHQQQIGFEQVSKGMEDVRRACEQSAAGTTELEKAAAGLSALTDQLRTSVEGYLV